jgi:hypothetical protein
LKCQPKFSFTFCRILNARGVQAGYILTCWFDTSTGGVVHAPFRFSKHLTGGRPEMNGIRGMWTFEPLELTSISFLLVEIFTAYCPDGINLVRGEYMYTNNFTIFQQFFDVHFTHKSVEKRQNIIQMPAKLKF